MSDDVVHRRFDRGERTATEAVVGAVASVVDRDPIELPPLQDTIDAEAFTALWQTPAGQHGLLHVAFEYAGCRVRVEDGGTVTVEPLVE